MKPIMLCINKTDIEKLIKLRKKTNNERLKKRIDVILLNIEGNTSYDIPRIIKCSESFAYNHIKNYQEKGYEGLFTKPRINNSNLLPRESLLRNEDNKKLTKIIKNGPYKYGFKSHFWTREMVVNMIEKEFSIKYSTRHVSRIIKKLNLSIFRKGTEGPNRLFSPESISRLTEVYSNIKITVKQICENFNISASTFYNYIKINTIRNKK